MFFNKKTKIIATIGPASEDPEMLEKMILAGVDCIRLNFSHGTQEEHNTKMERARAIQKKTGKHLAIIADIQGPKMRVGKLPKEGVMLQEGQEIVLDCSTEEFENNIIPLPSKMFMEGTKAGDVVFLDDGVLKLRILRKTGPTFQALVLKGGLLFSNKGSNVPALEIKGSVLSEKDRSDISFAIGMKPDYIALSFLRNAKDVHEAKKFINDDSIKIIAKIERPEALINIDEIIEAVDAIMVARGDLGIETPLWELPVRQKEIVEKVRAKMKPVIVATQMLDSMIRNSLPTRAEVSDVANAVHDSADAVMLSGESAFGKNPLETVEMMRKILESTERSLPYIEDTTSQTISNTLAIARSAARIASQINARAIFTRTLSGKSAEVISYFRPKNNIVAITDSEKIANQLALVWGVTPFVLKKKPLKRIEDLVAPASAIVCVYDETFKFSGIGNTNTITIKTI